MGITPGSAEQRFPGYDVMGQSPAWDEVTRPWLSIGARYPTRQRSSRPRRSRRLVPSWTGCWPRTMIPGCPCSRPSISGWPSDAGTATATRACPKTPRHGVVRSPRWTRLRRRIPETRSPTSRVTISADHRRGPALQGRMARPTRIAFFSVWMRYACSAFYAHPWVWNEIGFGGPAYPRGYKYLALGAREPWEVAERDTEDPVPWYSGPKRLQRHASGLSSPDAARQGPAGE